MAASDLTLRIEHADGDVSEFVVPTPAAIDTDAVTLASIRIERALDRVARCEATVFRNEWEATETEIDRRDDEVFVLDDAGTKLFGGRLDDWQYRGTLVSVQLDSFERDARETDPPASFSRSGVSDATIAADLIGLIPAPVTAGTVDQTTASIDFAATHTPPGVMLREVAASTGADVRYRPDGTVDYLARRGTDRAETLSPSAGAVISEPRIRRSVREDTTDVRTVSRSDPTIFAEAEAVATGPDERQVVRVDKISSTSTSRLQSRADELAAEVAGAPEYLEVETALDPAALTSSPAVGDRYDLALPAVGIDTPVKIIEADRTIDAGGDRLDRVLLSNRKLTLRTR